MLVGSVEQGANDVFKPLLTMAAMLEWPCHWRCHTTADPHCTPQMWTMTAYSSNNAQLWDIVENDWLNKFSLINHLWYDESRVSWLAFCKVWRKLSAWFRSYPGFTTDPLDREFSRLFWRKNGPVIAITRNCPTRNCHGTQEYIWNWDFLFYVVS